VTTIADELKRIVDDPVPAEELEKAKNFAKGRFVLQLENPQGLILFGLRREVLEGQAVEPDEVLTAIDAVTAQDLQRVAQEVLGSNAFRFALIGPFDDSERFEKLLAV
jgi:predicted Zn-dependent peptidase